MWDENWILIERVVNNKTLVKTILFSDVVRINADSKLVGGKLKRTFEYVFRDGSTYYLPDDALVLYEPEEHKDLIREISKVIKV